MYMPIQAPQSNFIGDSTITLLAAVSDNISNIDNCNALHKTSSLIKNHLKDILHKKNHIYKIILAHLASNMASNTRKDFRAAGY